MPIYCGLYAPCTFYEPHFGRKAVSLGCIVPGVMKQVQAMPWLTRILYLFSLLSYTSESLNGTIIFDQVTVRLGFWVFYGLALLTWMVNLKHHHLDNTG